MNALIDNTGTWVNGTVTIPDPAYACCREITLYNMAYTNYTSTGYWMTWSDGRYGCDVQNVPHDVLERINPELHKRQQS